MDVERWRRTEELFHQALDLDEAMRGAFLDRECGGDAELRSDVERLLTADQAAAGRLDAAVGAAVRSLHNVVPRGSFIGPYEIFEPLGEGGMGRVYHARRSDDVFHKDVAIKIVKSGIDSAAILRRFQRERRILATLEHPSIARVLDGGSTDEGVPYLVMEYVDGRSLPDYATEHQLDLRGRLRLFAQICEAVQYAHDRQIVHRDLKPGNILVDATGRARLLDFGIATLAGGGDHAITATGAGMMTPRYASPEQVRGELVTAASDQYSLGVLLYELLTACQAHRIATDSPAGIIKAVCEDEVPTPSEAAHAAQNAGRHVPVPPGELKGDIDRIVLTAVAKDPAHRYASVQDMAEDIQRYLDSQPVLASSRSGTHRVRTAIRQQPAVAASLLAVVAAALVAGVYFLRPPRPAPGIVPADKLMLAVLPLDNLTGNDDRAYFVDGLHEEIISRLGRLQPSRLGVIARTSVLQYRGTSKPIAQIGRELGASYILEGGVREAGSIVRVTAQLIQVSDQTPLWTETYDRQLRDLFTVQSEIGAHVADSLSVDVLPDALAALERHEALSPEAYADYLRARYFWHRRALDYPSNAQRAADHFQSVTRAAPAYAPGFAGLGLAHHYLSSYLPSREQRRPLIDQAKSELAKALALDDRSATAQAALAWIRFRNDYEWKDAEAGLRKALALDPNAADIHQQMATLLGYGGRHEEAHREIQLALTLDPLSATIHDWAFYIYLAGQRWDKALEMSERLAQLVPDDATPIYCASLVHALRGDCGKALDELKKLEPGREIADLEVANQGNVLGRCGTGEEGLRLVRELERNPRSLAGSVAQVWASLGDRDNALRWLEESYRRREEFMIFMAVAPILRPLHNEPRFQALLRQINYPAEWAATP